MQWICWVMEQRNNQPFKIISKGFQMVCIIQGPTGNIVDPDITIYISKLFIFGYKHEMGSPLHLASHFLDNPRSQTSRVVVDHRCFCYYMYVNIFHSFLVDPTRVVVSLRFFSQKGLCEGFTGTELSSLGDKPCCLKSFSFTPSAFSSLWHLCRDNSTFSMKVLGLFCTWV